MKKYVVSLFPPHGEPSNVNIQADYVSAMPREIVFFDNAASSAKTLDRYEEFHLARAQPPVPPKGPGTVAIVQIGEGFSYALSVEE